MVQTLFGPPEKKTGLFDRLKQVVASTKAQLVERIEEAVAGKTTIDQALLDNLEATLITGDLGVKTTQEILAHLREQVARKKLTDPREVRAAIEQEILTILEHPAPSGAGPCSAPPIPFALPPLNSLRSGPVDWESRSSSRSRGPTLLP